MICGRGATPRLGGCAGFKPALLALGYEWDHDETLGFAHVPCVSRAQRKATGRTTRAAVLARY